MPTYSYECKKCKHEHEEFHAMSAAPRVKCPECGGICIKLMGTGAGIIFKGSGFYETDYKKKSGAHEAKTGGSGDSTAKSAGNASSNESVATKTESKPAPAKAKDS